MARTKRRPPLTETMFYTLVALREPAHGYRIMEQVEELSDGTVRIAAGTMYGILENLSTQGLIAAVPDPDPRRKVYAITAAGSTVLTDDVHRLQRMVDAASTPTRSAS
ncbi:MAG: PadR family transcriptional regulator [Micrococcales bacterium]|nr:PadR family transcriptional regulator [Micrococcales bacterium]